MNKQLKKSIERETEKAEKSMEKKLQYRKHLVPDLGVTLRIIRDAPRRFYVRTCAVPVKNKWRLSHMLMENGLHYDMIYLGNGTIRYDKVATFEGWRHV